MKSQIFLKNKSIIDKDTTQTDFLNILLKNRKIKKNSASDFFNPHYPDIGDFDINPKQLIKAVDRVNLAIKKGQNILIYGDYDVDGITSTAILWQVLYSKKAKILPFIPDREVDGYGIKAKSFFNFQTLKNLHFDLLITVDNGIVADKELSKIAAQGTDIIIVDHHITSKKLPRATAIIHSVNFSGSALSWLFASQFDDKADLGLAAAGTVADCLPLISTNRNIVIHGLKSLQSKASCGVQKLIEISGIKQETLSAYDLGFVIGPRINAVGRLSNPTEALRLLCSQSPSQAQNYAKNLDNFNKERQSIQKEDLLSAELKVKHQDKLIFVSDKNYLPGIIGLIAGRLTEKYNLPSIVVSVGHKYSKASCRSISNINIIDLLRNFRNLLVDLGGHAGAAGFTIETKNLEEFQKKITEYTNKKLKDVDLTTTLDLESEMKLSALTVKNCKIIDQFQPFGIANPKPLFLFKKLRIVDKRVIGANGDHLKLRLDDPNTSIRENVIAEAIAFKKGNLDCNLKIGELVDLVASLELNNWNNKVTPQLFIKDILIT